MFICRYFNEMTDCRYVEQVNLLAEHAGNEDLQEDVPSLFLIQASLLPLMYNEKGRHWLVETSQQYPLLMNHLADPQDTLSNAVCDFVSFFLEVVSEQFAEYNLKVHLEALDDLTRSSIFPETTWTLKNRIMDVMACYEDVKRILRQFLTPDTAEDESGVALAAAEFERLWIDDYKNTHEEDKHNRINKIRSLPELDAFADKNRDIIVTQPNTPWAEKSAHNVDCRSNPVKVYRKPVQLDNSVITLDHRKEPKVKSSLKQAAQKKRRRTKPKGQNKQKEQQNERDSSPQDSQQSELEPLPPCCFSHKEFPALPSHTTPSAPQSQAAPTSNSDLKGIAQSMLKTTASKNRPSRTYAFMLFDPTLKSDTPQVRKQLGPVSSQKDIFPEEIKKTKTHEQSVSQTVLDDVKHDCDDNHQTDNNHSKLNISKIKISNAVPNRFMPSIHDNGVLTNLNDHAIMRSKYPSTAVMASDLEGTLCVAPPTKQESWAQANPICHSLMHLIHNTEDRNMSPSQKKIRNTSVNSEGYISFPPSPPTSQYIEKASQALPAHILADFAHHRVPGLGFNHTNTPLWKSQSSHWFPLFRRLVAEPPSSFTTIGPLRLVVDDVFNISCG